MTTEWKDLVSDPGVWSTNGRGMWVAVWPLPGGKFAAWRTGEGPYRARTSCHETEAAARTWCEDFMMKPEER